MTIIQFQAKKIYFYWFKVDFKYLKKIKLNYYYYCCFFIIFKENWISDLKNIHMIIKFQTLTATLIHLFNVGFWMGLNMSLSTLDQAGNCWYFVNPKKAEFRPVKVSNFGRNDFWNSVLWKYFLRISFFLVMFD